MDNQIKRTHLVAESVNEVKLYEVEKLTEALTAKFGSRGLEFKLVTPFTDPPGAAGIISVQYPGFAVFNTTVDNISDFVQEWAKARGPTTEHPDLY